jgi:hypothetical protein
MAEAWEMIRHVAEVLGMIFLPVLGWMLLTLTNHSKKIILLEERVNETITNKLTALERNFQELDEKVDKNHNLINKIDMSVERIDLTLRDKDSKIDSILEVVKKLSEK